MEIWRQKFDRKTATAHPARLIWRWGTKIDLPNNAPHTPADLPVRPKAEVADLAAARAKKLEQEKVAKADEVEHKTASNKADDLLNAGTATEGAAATAETAALGADVGTVETLSLGKLAAQKTGDLLRGARDFAGEALQTLKKVVGTSWSETWKMTKTIAGGLAEMVAHPVNAIQEMLYATGEQIVAVKNAITSGDTHTLGYIGTAMVAMHAAGTVGGRVLREVFSRGGRRLKSLFGKDATELNAPETAVKGLPDSTSTPTQAAKTLPDTPDLANVNANDLATPDVGALPQPDLASAQPTDIANAVPTDAASATHSQADSDLDSQQSSQPTLQMNAVRAAAETLSPEAVVAKFAGQKPVGAEFGLLKNLENNQVLMCDMHGRVQIASATEFGRLEKIAKATPEKPLMADFQTPEVVVKDLDLRRAARVKNAAAEAGIPPAERAAWAAAHLDPATGLYSRSVINEAAHRMKDWENLTAVSFDGDFFGPVNKFLGTASGDHFIRVMGDEFAQAIENLKTKGIDAVAGRMGGEEFVVLADASADAMAAEMALLKARLKVRMREHLTSDQLNEFAQYLKHAKEVPLEQARAAFGDATLGVSSLPTNALSHAVSRVDEVTGMLHSADGLLEHGKNNNGRGTIHTEQRKPERLASGLDAHEKIPSHFSKEQKAFLTAHEDAVAARLAAQSWSETPARQNLYFRRRVALSSPEWEAVRLAVEAPTPHALPAELLAKNPALSGEVAAARAEYIGHAATTERTLGTLTTAAFERLAKAPHFAGGTRLTIDPQQFKAFNETLGHGVADTVLAEMALTTRDVLRRHLLDCALVAKNLSKLEVQLPAGLAPAREAAVIKEIQEQYAKNVANLLQKSGSEKRLGKWLAENVTAEKLAKEPAGTVAIKTAKNGAPLPEPPPTASPSSQDFSRSSKVEAAVPNAQKPAANDSFRDKDLRIRA